MGAHWQNIAYRSEFKYHLFRAATHRVICSADDCPNNATHEHRTPKGHAHYCDEHHLASLPEIDRLLARDGWAIESELIADDFDGRDGANRWRVTISRAGRSYQTEFTQGAGCRHYKQSGKPIGMQPRTGKVGYFRDLVRITAPDAPTLADVLHCVVSECDVVNYATFEDWAECFGYDTDSRKAEAIYRGCLATYTQLRQIADIETLEKQFADF